MKLLIVADDLTGTLDTGIKFADRGIRVRVLNTTEDRKDWFRDETEVVVINTNTRHLPQKDAYRIVFETVKRGRELGCDNVYKKTDSGLRGRIGAEITAVASAMETGVVFAPALPSAHRITVGGIHYCDGVPVSESAFGRDPIDPVEYSEVREILLTTGGHGMSVSLGSGTSYRSPGIGEVLICDASSDEDLHRIAEHAADPLEGQIPVLCGCAGFAEALAEVLPFMKTDRLEKAHKPKILFLSGSMHPMTKAQIRYAKEQGVFCQTVTAAALLREKAFLDGNGDGGGFDSVLRAVEADGCGIYAVDPDNDAETLPAAAQAGIAKEDIPLRLTEVLADKAKYAAKHIRNLCLFITGGDTLEAVLRTLHADEIIPLTELSPGIVELELVLKDGEQLSAISKAGGLGSIDAVAEILKGAR